MKNVPFLCSLMMEFLFTKVYILLNIFLYTIELNQVVIGIKTKKSYISVTLFVWCHQESNYPFKWLNIFDLRISK